MSTANAGTSAQPVADTDRNRLLTKKEEQGNNNHLRASATGYGTVHRMTSTDFANKFEWVRALDDPNSGLTSTQHHVALALSGHLNAKGTGFVTHAQLALETRMSERTVCAALTALADAHWIERVPGRPGRATNYTITKKYGWTPTPEEEKATRPRRRRRPADPEGREKAISFIAGVYRETDVDPARASDDTQVANRLIGVIRRHLNSAVGDAATLAPIRRVLVETSMASVNEPAAVLLTRYQKALRMYPHLRPVAASENPIDDVIAQIGAALLAK